MYHKLASFCIQLKVVVLTLRVITSLNESKVDFSALYSLVCVKIAETCQISLNGCMFFCDLLHVVYKQELVTWIFFIHWCCGTVV